MHERIVTKIDAEKINSILFPEDTIKETIALINSKIVPLEFKINQVICEQNGDVYYVFIATFNDDSNCKPDPDKKIFIELANYIIEAGGLVPYAELLMFNKNGISDMLLDNFFTKKYLTADKDKNIFLSPLAINELEGYLVNKFREKKCMCCMSVVGHGFKCDSCENFAHGHCLLLYFKNVHCKKCPKCYKMLSVEWNPIKIMYEL
jgi:hypothetical protein